MRAVLILALVAALAAGNRAMIKMSEFSPRTTDLLARMLGDVFPENEVAVFGGEMEEAQAFSRLPFDHLVFTGSPAVGRHIMRAAAENLVPLSFELGGKSPFIVFADADLDLAVSTAVGQYDNAGQVCLAGTRILVEESIRETFIAAFIEKAKKIRQGDPHRRGQCRSVGPFDLDPYPPTHLHRQ